MPLAAQSGSLSSRLGSLLSVGAALTLSIVLKAVLVGPVQFCEKVQTCRGSSELAASDEPTPWLLTPPRRLPPTLPRQPSRLNELDVFGLLASGSFPLS